MCKFLPDGEMLGCVRYMAVLCAASSHHGFAIVVTDVAPILVAELVYKNNLKGNGRTRMLVTEQKRVALMKDLVYECLISDDSTLNAFERMISKSNAFLLLDKHSPFVGLPKDSGCLEKLMPRLSESYSCQLVNGMSALKGRK